MVNTKLSSLKTGPALPGHVKIAQIITAVDFDQFYLYSAGTFSNEHMSQTQPVATSLHALKGQTLTPFNLGGRLPFRILCIEIEAHIKTTNESKST